jgi:hypothetical protein
MSVVVLRGSVLGSLYFEPTDPVLGVNGYASRYGEPVNPTINTVPSGLHATVRTFALAVIVMAVSKLLPELSNGQI